MKYKEKDEKKFERNKTDAYSKLKAYKRKKEKCIKNFAFQNQKIIDGSI